MDLGAFEELNIQRTIQKFKELVRRRRLEICDAFLDETSKGLSTEIFRRGRTQIVLRMGSAATSIGDLKSPPSNRNPSL